MIGTGQVHAVHILSLNSPTTAVWKLQATFRPVQIDNTSSQVCTTCLSHSALGLIFLLWCEMPVGTHLVHTVVQDSRCVNTLLVILSPLEQKPMDKCLSILSLEQTTLRQILYATQILQNPAVIIYRGDQLNNIFWGNTFSLLLCFTLPGSSLLQPGTPSQVSYLHTNPCLRLHFWEDPKVGQGSQNSWIIDLMLEATGVQIFYNVRKVNLILFAVTCSWKHSSPKPVHWGE